MKPSLSHGRTQKFTRVAVAAACLLMCLLSQPASALFIGKLPIWKQPIHVGPLAACRTQEFKKLSTFGSA